MNAYVQAHISLLLFRLSSLVIMISSISRYYLHQTFNTWSLQCKQWWVSTLLLPASATAMDSWVDIPKTLRTITLTSSVTAKCIRYTWLINMILHNGKITLYRKHRENMIEIAFNHICYNFASIYLFIHLIDLSIHPSILAIYPSIHPSINGSIT
jgi:hypothetical protein